MSILKQRRCIISTAAWAMINPVLPVEGSGLELVSVDNSSGGAVLANFRTFDIYLDESGPDWIWAETSLRLTNGSLYQDPAGEVIAPDPDAFTDHPSLEFDTYVGILDDTTTLIEGPATMLSGELEMRFDTTGLDVRWSNTADETGLSQIPIIRVSLSSESDGIWEILAAREGEPLRRLGLAIGTFRWAGDLNADGFVGQDDLNLVLTYWGQTVPPGDRSQGDPSGDSFVGQDDLTTVLGDWGQGTLPEITAFNPVPEPRSLLLVFVAIVFIAPTRVRQSAGKV